MAIIKDPLPSHRAIQEEAHVLINRLRPQIRSYFCQPTANQHPHILEAFDTSLSNLNGLLGLLDVACEKLEEKASIEFDKELDRLSAAYVALRSELDRMQLLLASGYLTRGMTHRQAVN